VILKKGRYQKFWGLIRFPIDPPRRNSKKLLSLYRNLQTGIKKPVKYV
jgi:hypothetical protein